MREILFRAKCIDNGEWGYGVPIKDALAGSHDGYYPKIIPECDGRHQTIYSTAIKEETLGQYTGLKDKNNKKIFEGDVIKNKGYNFSVYWDDEYAGFYPFYDQDHPAGYGVIGEESEVIGNIHDNPELLEGEK